MRRLIPVVMVTSPSQGYDIVESCKRGVYSDVAKLVDFDHFSGTMARAGFDPTLLNKGLQ